MNDNNIDKDQNINLPDINEQNINIDLPEVKNKGVNETIININNESKINEIFFFGLLVSFFYVSWLIFEPFWEIIVFSIFIVIVSNPYHKKILSKMNNNETTSALLSTFIVFLFVLIPGFFFTFIIIAQMIDIFPLIVKFFSEKHEYNYYFAKIPTFLTDFYDKGKLYLDAAGVNTNVNILELIKNYIGKVAEFTIQQSQSILANIGSVLINLAFILLTIFFLFRDSDKYVSLIKSIVPMNEEDKSFLIKSSAQGVRAIFLGTIITAFVQGFLGFIAYFMADVKFSFFWGFATFLCSFFPLGGSAIIWLPITIYCFVVNGWLTGLIMLLWGALIITMSDNIIRPIVVGNNANIGTLPLVFSMMGGVPLFGFIGLFVAPVIVINAISILELYKKRISSQN